MELHSSIPKQQDKTRNKITGFESSANLSPVSCGNYISIFNIVSTEWMKDYHDDHNKSIVIRTKTRNKVCTKRSGFVQKKTYLLKISHSVLVDTAPRLELPTSLDLFFSVKETLNFKHLELRSWRTEKLRLQNPNQFPYFMLIKPVFCKMAQQKALHSFGGCPVFEQLSPWQGTNLVLLPFDVSHSNFLCVNRYPHPLYIIS